MPQNKEPEERRISVAEFVALVGDRLRIEVISEPSILTSHYLQSPRVQKLGLALSGFADKIHKGRIQIYGNSERSYFDKLTHLERDESISRLDRENISCILITAGVKTPGQLSAFALENKIPLLRTNTPSSESISTIAGVLSEALAPESTIHGVLLEVFGIGVLIVGESGIGKSECALDLITRGHRLIADDTVEVRRTGETAIIGTCPDLTRFHMEVRGLGVINIRDLFGVAATRISKRVELVVQLERWDPTREYDRLGLDEKTYELFQVKVPVIHMPVAPGRSLAILVEVAARNQLLRSRGLNAARDLAQRLERQLHEPEEDREEGPGNGDGR